MYKEKNLNLSDVKNILKAYAKVLKKHNISLEKMYLYGSFAKGNNTLWSDIDIVVISKDFANNVEKEDILWATRENIDLRISPLSYTPEEWEEEISIKDQVDRYGIRIID